jgi:long-chain acyl-CoA synthetase
MYPGIVASTPRGSQNEDGYARDVFELTPVEVFPQAALAAGWLRHRGLRAGDRVAVVSRNDPRFVPFTLGALCTGVVPVLVNTGLPGAERDRILTDAEPEVVFAGNWPGSGRAKPVDLAPHPLARPMHYTSGTTGASKGVWSGSLDEADAAALAEDERELWGAGPGDTVLVCSPLYHSAPHRIAVSALLAGARVLVAEAFDAAEVAETFAREGVTHAFVVPTHLRRLLDVGLHAPAARRILHAGEACPEPLKRAVIDTFPPSTVWEFLGSTEGQFAMCSSDEWLERPGTVGRARTGRRLSVRDPGPDGVGTVFVTAPSFARWEYWRDPDKTAQAWDGDAFTVGDLGRLDEDGYLFLATRREDLIISGGVNVYPAEVERVLLGYPGVSEAAVFGSSDPEWGQRVCAAIVGDADPEAVRAWARARLAPAQAPKTIVAIEALPRTASGKVRRSALDAGPS